MRVTSLIEFVRRNPILGLGRGCLLFGALMIVSAVGFVLAQASIEALSADARMKSRQPSAYEAFIQRNHKALGLVQLSLGVVVGLTGVAVLKRRAWARVLLEGLVWVGLVGMLIVGSLFTLSDHGLSGSARSFVVIGGSFSTLLWVAAGAYFVSFLRSHLVRKAFQAS